MEPVDVDWPPANPNETELVITPCYNNNIGGEVVYRQDLTLTVCRTGHCPVA